MLQNKGREITRIMNPLFQNMEEGIKSMGDRLQHKNHADLDSTKWKMGNQLEQVKQLIMDMTKSFDAQDEYVQCIEKISGAISMIVDVYNRIDSYRDECNLVELIASVQSDNLHDRPSKYSDEINEIELLLAFNIASEQYERALHAYKQRYFPIAGQLDADLSHNVDSEERNVEEMTRKINDISSSNARFKSQLVKIKNHIIDYKSLHSNNIQPFFIWRKADHMDDFERLLNGKVISLNADITKFDNKSLCAHAVKFKEIGLRFKFSNETLQKEFLKLMRKIKITMGMSGRNHYRCDDHVYSITVNDDIEIKYSMGQDKEQNNCNENYSTIKRNNPLISPYTMWRIKFDSVDERKSQEYVDKLQKFKGQIESIQLVGTGEYLENGPHLTNVCKDLYEFYELDKVLTKAIQMHLHR